LPSTLPLPQLPATVPVAPSTPLPSTASPMYNSTIPQPTVR
jgi:hypothetical protein